MSLSLRPSTKQYEWPAERDYAAYDFMCGGRLNKMIRKGRISAAEIVIDVGPGKFCSALAEIARRVEGAALYAIAPHKPEAIPSGITFFPGLLPKVEFRINSAKLITDIFSGVSYAIRTDLGSVVPIGHEVLIRLAGWLKPGGVLIACTEVKRLGNSEDHKRISEFFRTCMGLTCTFQIYEKFAEGNRVLEDQLRITIKNKQSFEKLIKKAGEIFPVRKERAFVWHPPKLENPFHRSVIGKDLNEILSPYDTFLNLGLDLEQIEKFAANTKLQWVSIQRQKFKRDLENLDFSSIGKMNLITDIFEFIALSEDQAIEMLIKTALQLAPQGRLIVCAHLMSFGDPAKDWKTLSNFFRSEMGLSCTIEAFQLDNTPDIYSRVTIERKQTFEDLVELAAVRIGIPSAGKVLWESKEKEPSERIRIYETIFTPAESEKVSASPNATPAFESEALEVSKYNYGVESTDTLAETHPKKFSASHSFQ